MTTLLAVDDLSTGYLGVPVVRHLSMNVHEGEVVALLGPNGAGKTTTLLAISGINPVLAGRIEVFDRSDRPPQAAQDQPQRSRPRARGPVAVLPVDRTAKTSASAPRIRGRSRWPCATSRARTTDGSQGRTALRR